MSEQTFLIQKWDGESLKPLITLSKTYYKTGDIINENYLKWQYLGNPSGSPFLYLSKEKNTSELAGQYLVIPIKYKIDSTEILGSLSLNTLTHPKYQGRGLFTKMAKATYQKCSESNANITIGFPNPLSYPGFVKKLNFNHLGNIPLLIRPLKIHRIILSFIRKKREKHGGEINLIIPKHDKVKRADFLNPDFQSKYNAFWDKLKSQYKVTSVKSFEYLKWRYHDIPTRTYEVLYFEENDTIKGVIVLKAENIWGFRVGVIMDLLIPDNNTSVGKQILKFAIKSFRKTDLDFIAALHSKSYEYLLLKKLSFFEVNQRLLPQKTHFIIRVNKKFPESRTALKLSNWKLSFGDYDVF